MVIEREQVKVGVEVEPMPPDGDCIFKKLK